MYPAENFERGSIPPVDAKFLIPAISESYQAEIIDVMVNGQMFTVVSANDVVAMLALFKRRYNELSAAERASVDEATRATFRSRGENI